MLRSGHLAAYISPEIAVDLVSPAAKATGHRLIRKDDVPAAVIPFAAFRGKAMQLPVYPDLRWRFDPCGPHSICKLKLWWINVRLARCSE
jgi:hypothetical protein